MVSIARGQINVGILERQINIGGNSRSGATQGLMLSGDQNIVDVQFSVLYSIVNPKNYLFQVEQPETCCGRSPKVPCAKWLAGVGAGHLP